MSHALGTDAYLVWCRVPWHFLPGWAGDTEGPSLECRSPCSGERCRQGRAFCHLKSVAAPGHPLRPSPLCHPSTYPFPSTPRAAKPGPWQRQKPGQVVSPPSSFGHCVPAPSHSVGVPRGGAVYAGLRKIPGPPPRLQVRGGRDPGGRRLCWPRSLPLQSTGSQESLHKNARPSGAGRSMGAGQGRAGPTKGRGRSPGPSSPGTRALWGAGAPARATPTPASAGAEGWMGPPL